MLLSKRLNLNIVLKRTLDIVESGYSLIIAFCSYFFQFSALQFLMCFFTTCLFN